MTPHELMAAFDAVADAPDGVGRLRELVLELAVRGRLVPQDPADEPASVLLERIAAERARLVRAGEVTAHEPASVPNAGDLPWDVPPGWVWSCTSAVGVLSPRYEADDHRTVAFGPMHVIPTDFREAIRPEQRRWGDIKKGYTHFADGDVVVAKITPCFQNGKSCVMEGLHGIGAGTTELHVVSPVAGAVNPKYLLLFYKSPGFIDGGVARMTGTAGQQRVPRDYFAHTPLPLPPLAEQRRIVARVDELMGLVDRLEAARTTRDATRAAVRDSVLAALREADAPSEVEVAWSRFAERMDDLLCDPADIAPLRQAVLQLAVRGRLVQQDAGEEPAATLHALAAAERDELVQAGEWRGARELPPVDPDEAWFHTPPGWTWMRLGSACRFIDYRGHTPAKTLAGVRLITAKNIRRGFVQRHPEEFVAPETYKTWMRRGFPERGDVLFTMEAPLGNAAEVDFDKPFALAQRAINMHPLGGIVGRFLMHMLLSPIGEAAIAAQASGMTARGIKAARLRLIPIPLPPLAEQRRIVTRVDELMGLLDRLEARLTATQATHAAFAAAAVHHLDA